MIISFFAPHFFAGLDPTDNERHRRIGYRGAARFIFVLAPYCQLEAGSLKFRSSPLPLCSSLIVSLISKRGERSCSVLFWLQS